MTVTTTASPTSCAPLVPIDRAHRDDLVAVDQLPVSVDGEDPVGIAVEREPDVGLRVEQPLPARPAGRSPHTRR